MKELIELGMLPLSLYFLDEKKTPKAQKKPNQHMLNWLNILKGALKGLRSA